MHGERNELIVRAAIQGGCERILRENLQDGRKIRGVKVMNPFRSTSPKRPNRS
jgi:predicted nucleic acid-binding protein